MTYFLWFLCDLGEMVLNWYLVFILLIPSCIADKDTLPVLMLDYECIMTSVNVDANPFSKISSARFTNIILDAIKISEGIIIFVEERFCIEDVSAKDKLLGSPYFNLHKGLLENKVKFMPAVEEPYRTLKQIFQPHDYNVFYLRSEMKLELTDNFKFIYVFFHDGLNETRYDVLRRHDLIMKDVYYAVRQLKQGPILAFYTGKVNPVDFEKMEFVPIKPNPVPKDMGVLVVTSGALFRFSGVYATTVKRRSLFNQLPMVAEETWTRRKLSTRMAYTDFEIQFNFSFRDKDWMLDNVVLLEGGEDVGRTEMRIGAPWNYSYVCGEPLVLINTRDGSLITISQYQLQPLARRQYDTFSFVAPKTANYLASAPVPQFGKSVNCAPYFTSSVIACLFVTFICLCICFWGILLLFNCNSNNRFDDPQGKQLVLTEN